MPIHEQKDKKAELLKILEKAYAEAESNNLSMYFVKKPSSEKIQAFQPQMGVCCATYTHHLFVAME